MFHSQIFVGSIIPIPIPGVILKSKQSNETHFDSLIPYGSTIFRFQISAHCLCVFTPRII